MKISYILKNNFHLFMNNIKYFLSVALILPLMLGFFYGLLYSKMLTPDVKLKSLNLYTSYSNNSEKEKSTIKSLLSYPNYSFVKESEVSKDEIETLLSKDTTALGLILEENNLTIVSNGNLTLEKSIVKDGLNRLSYLNANVKVLDIASQDVDVDKTLAPKPKMFLSIFCGMSLFISISLGSLFLKRRETSIVKRLYGCNLSKKDLFLGEYLSCFIITFVLTILFSFIAYKLICGMDINIVKLLFSSFIHAILVSCLYCFILGVFRTDKTLQIIFMPLLIALMFLGGTFFPADFFMSPKNPILLFNPITNISKIFEMFLLNNNFNSIFSNLIFIGILSLILILIGYFKFSFEEV